MSSKEHKRLSGDNISNVLPICPQCNNTKNLMKELTNERD